MIFRNQGSLIKKSNSISRDELINLYGLNSYEFTQTKKEEIFVCSKNKDLDLIELDQLLQTVGWSRRPIRRVKRALDFSILVVGYGAMMINSPDWLDLQDALVMGF